MYKNSIDNGHIEAGFVQVPGDRQIVIASMLHNNAGFTVQTFQTFNQTSEFMKRCAEFQKVKQPPHRRDAG